MPSSPRQKAKNSESAAPAALSVRFALSFPFISMKAFIAIILLAVALVAIGIGSVQLKTCQEQRALIKDELDTMKSCYDCTPIPSDGSGAC